MSARLIRILIPCNQSMNVVIATERRMKYWLGKLVCITVLCCGSGGLFAQEQATATASVAAENEQPSEAGEPLDRTRILYIDVPIPVEAGVEPAFPLEVEATEVPDSISAQGRVRIMRDYDSAISAIEADGGAWDQALTEELSALGRLQQQEGNHPAALETLSRAMHINRINQGLHTLTQVPLVEAMIDSYMAQGNWAKVDLYQNYLYFVQQKVYGSEDPRLIPVLHRLGQWNLLAFSLGFGDPLGGRLSTAQLLFNAVTRMVGIHFGRNDERYVSSLRNLANSAYLVSSYPEYMSEALRPEFRNSQELLRVQLSDSLPADPSGYRAGESALQEVVDVYRERGDSPYQLAEALANLADWQLIFGRTQTAEGLYGEAWQILAERENGEELIDRLFGQVIPIPTFARLPSNLLMGSSDSQQKPSLHHDYADVRFDVSQNGAPRNVEVLTEETEGNGRQLSRLRREVLRSTFRPLIVDGHRVESEGHLFRYRYWY